MVFVWIGFFVIIGILLAIDLGVLNKTPKALSVREAAIASGIWIAIGLSFSALVFLIYEFHWGGIGSKRYVDGLQAVQEYTTAYLIEQSLSVDNIFVIALLMRFFKVRSEHQHRVLYWGILGAIVFRGIMIAAGSALVASFDWIFYVFGVVLFYTAWKMMFGGEDDIDPSQSRVFKLAERILPVDNKYHDDRFRVTIDGKKVFTLLFVVVLVIEATDVVFAVDSIPAIFGFTQEPFIIMTSNIFAILGLRSLYFVVAGAMREFRYLKLAVSVILLLVGVKMFLHTILEDPPGEHTIATISLIAVVAILAAGVIASIVANRRDQKAGAIDEPPLMAAHPPATPPSDDLPPSGDAPR
ncbi:MAG: TerC family protein [Myxococcota bacterium]